jgi:ATP-binding protein involved in chromosome partitioning
VRKFRTYHEVDHATRSELLEQVLEQRARLSERLTHVGAVVAVASGKGGVGKSAVTANLAATLAVRGHDVAVLDADLNGPSLARMLGVAGRILEDGDAGVVPPTGAAGVRVMSMELLQDGADAPLRWREPQTDTFLWQSSMETTALREFLGDVQWGSPRFLLVDMPPGTDKIRRLLELVPDLPLALLVGTPSEMSRAVVSRSLRLVREARVPGIALVANMTEFVCPACGHGEKIFAGDGMDRLATDSGVPIWGRIPFDPRLAESTDTGVPRVLEDPGGAVGRAFAELAARVETGTARASRPGAGPQELGGAAP